jgi:hypothetical protein
VMFSFSLLIDPPSVDMLVGPPSASEVIGQARRFESLARGVDYAKPVSLGIGEDDVVRIRRSLVPVDLDCA